MELAHVTVALKGLRTSAGTYEADFLVDTGATDCLAPAGKLRQIEVQPVGTTVYELADGTKHEYAFGLVEIRFMGEITAGRVVFGPDDAEPVLGVTALESVGITIDPASRTLKRLPAIPLKSTIVAPTPPRGVGIRRADPARRGQRYEVGMCARLRRAGGTPRRWRSRP
jgi:clan AA aspartic protease